MLLLLRAPVKRLTLMYFFMNLRKLC